MRPSRFASFFSFLSAAFPGFALALRARERGVNASAACEMARETSLRFWCANSHREEGDFRVIGGGQTHLFACLIFFFSASVSLSFLAAGLGGMVRVRWVGSCE